VKLSYAHAAEKYINEYVNCMLVGEKSKATHFRKLLMKHFNYTRAELDIFVEERLIEIDKIGKTTEQLDTSKLDVNPYFEST
jgi:hypothetical protein